MYRKTPTSVLIWYFFPVIFPKLDGGSNIAFHALQKIVTTFMPGQPLHGEGMWASFLAHANMTRCSLSCLSTTSPATPSNYFNHAFILPPACSAQLSWRSPGNYSKIRWEAELKHASSGGCKNGRATTRGSAASLWDEDISLSHISSVCSTLSFNSYGGHTLGQWRGWHCIFPEQKVHTPNNIAASSSAALAANSFCLLMRAQVKKMERERRGQGDV